MAQFEFLEGLEEIIVDQFEVLNEDYARDMAKEIVGTLAGAIEHEKKVCYVIIDGETGQLESRRFFEEYSWAANEIKDKNLTHCTVGTLIVES